MDRLTYHFTFDELTKTSHADLQDKNRKEAEQYRPKLIQICTELEKIRDFVSRPIIINSGFRCQELNTLIKGSKTSQHMIGEAVDFTVKDFEPITALQFMFYWCGNHLNYGQLILENPKDCMPWIHYGLPREGRKPTKFFYEDGIYKPI